MNEQEACEYQKIADCKIVLELVNSFDSAALLQLKKGDLTKARELAAQAVALKIAADRLSGSPMDSGEPTPYSD